MVSLDNNDFEAVFNAETYQNIRKEYDRLGDQCYLDHTGGALYTKSYIEECFKDLSSHVYSNPHSNSTSSKHTTDLIDQVRYRILQHFNTDVDEYSVIFTGGATEAIKLVAESFEWENVDREKDVGESGEFVYMEDNHTSVLGMRGLVQSRGARVKCLSHQETLEIFQTDLENPDTTQETTNSLFVYSAQCNFSGVKYPLSWVEKVHKGIINKRSKWYCLLDAASYVSTSKLDLNVVRPDFVCISFYKIFGYPTGLGALLVRNCSAGVLQRLYYGGGTVLMALSAVPEHVPRPAIHERYEDGTLNYVSIVSLNHALSSLERIIKDNTKLSKHCFQLAKYAFYSMLKLHHTNGQPAVMLYADTTYDDETTQGNIVNFNMLRPNGEYIGYAEVLNMANMHEIQLRTGCFCNPGACRRHLGLTSDDVRSHYEAGHVCGDDNDLVNGRPTGSVRVSFGLHNDKQDVDRLMMMLDKCFVQQPALRQWPINWSAKAKELRNKFRKDNHKDRKMNPNGGVQREELTRQTAQHRKEQHEERTINLKILDHIDPSDRRCQRKPELYISQIFLYPIKSCGRLSVEKWEIDSKGLKYDRQWMITTTSGVALTQKTEPMLCLIRPYIDEANNVMHLTFKGARSMVLPLNPSLSDRIKDGYSLCQSKVCGDRIRGYDCGDEVALWLSEVLNRPNLRLIHQLPDDNRLNKNGLGALTLSNQSQFLFVNEASVKWLSDQLEEDSECSKESMINRFRSNFVLSGTEEEFVERLWTKITIGSSTFNVDGPCSRCQMICIDQDSGKKTKEPLTTLTAAFQGKMKFGIYLSRADTSLATVAVNDEVIPSVDRDNVELNVGE